MSRMFVNILLCVLISCACFAAETQVVQRSFYGKVIDINSQPVSSGYLVLELSDKDSTTEKVVICDPNGQFDFKCDADTIEVKTVIRQGYVLDQSRKTKFNVASSIAAKDPVEIILKKTGKPGIVRNSYSFTFWAGSPKDHLVDLSKDRGKEFKVFSKPDIKKTKKPAWVSGVKADKTKKFSKADKAQKVSATEKISKQINDIKISAAFLENEQAWQVQLLPVSQGTSFQVLNDARRRCPLAGYASELKLTAKAAETFRKYVYVKARDGQIYSRLVIDIKNNEKVLIVNISNRANTMSSPILELDHKGMFFDSNKEKIKQQEQEKEAGKQQRRQRDKERKFNIGR